MPRRRVCAGGCGRLLYVGPGSGPEPVCHACRRSGAWRKQHVPKTPATRECRNCAATFTPAPQQVHCSDRCKQRYKKRLRKARTIVDALVRVCP